MSLSKVFIEMEEAVKEQPQPFDYEAEKPYIIRVKDEVFNLYDFRYNEITDALEHRRREDKETDFCIFKEEALNSLWIEFQLSKIFGSKEKPSIMFLDRILNSNFTPRYNALKEYFNGLKWDGKDHIGFLASTVSVSEIHIDEQTVLPNLWVPLLRRWLIAAAACMLGRSPNQVMLLLIGAQGKYKTTWLNRLCPAELKDYRFTGHINPDLTDNGTANLLAEKAFLNIDDQLETLFGKDFNKIKSIISIDYINNRKAFRKDAKRRTRIANIMGSVNGDKLFLDVENRRYLTFKVDAIDIETKVNISQVWAQAYELLKTERHWFDGLEVAQINTINGVFTINTPEYEWLLKCYQKAEPGQGRIVKYVMFNEILSVLKAASGLTLRDGYLRNALKRAGWEQVSKRVGEEKQPRNVYPVQEQFVIGDYGKIKVLEQHI